MLWRADWGTLCHVICHLCLFLIMWKWIKKLYSYKEILGCFWELFLNTIMFCEARFGIFYFFYLLGTLFPLNIYDVCICDKCLYVCVNISMSAWVFLYMYTYRRITFIFISAKAPGKKGHSVLDSCRVRGMGE